MTFTKRLAFLLFLQAASTSALPHTASASPPIVDLGYAKYQGTFIQDKINNATRTQFLGVRFAAPPTSAFLPSFSGNPTPNLILQVQQDLENQLFLLPRQGFSRPTLNHQCAFKELLAPVQHPHSALENLASEKEFRDGLPTMLRTLALLRIVYFLSEPSFCIHTRCKN